MLSVRGNVSDVALTNWAYYLRVHAAGALPAPVDPGLDAPDPETFEAFRTFLAPRETQSAEEAIDLLRRMNESFAAEMERLPEKALESPVRLFRPTGSARAPLPLR